MSERRLATIRPITEIVPLFDREGQPALSVEGVYLDGWFSIIQKGAFQRGEQVIYLEIDTILNPELPWVQKHIPFMEKHQWRLKTLSLRNLCLPDENGQPTLMTPVSQGLVLSLAVLDEIEGGHDDTIPLDTRLGLTKYERPAIAYTGDARGAFPSHLKKTDEERIQNFAAELIYFTGKPWVATYKMDGSSTTVWLDEEGVVRLASRTLEVYNDGKNYYSRALESQPGIEPLLRENPHIAAVQGESVGEGVQANPHGIKGHRLIVFNLIDRLSRLPIPYTQMVELSEKYGVEIVKYHSGGDSFNYTMKDCLEIVSGLKAINYDQVKSKRSKWAEGLVFRLNMDKPIVIASGHYASFKVINPNYLLDHGE